MVNVHAKSNMECSSNLSSYEFDAGSSFNFGVSNYSKDYMDVMNLLSLSISLFIIVLHIYFSLYISLVISSPSCLLLVSLI